MVQSIAALTVVWDKSSFPSELKLIQLLLLDGSGSGQLVLAALLEHSERLFWTQMVVSAGLVKELEAWGLLLRRNAILLHILEEGLGLVGEHLFRMRVGIVSNVLD